MAEIVDPITGLVTYTDPQDIHPMRVDYNERTEIFNALMAIAVKGLSTARPVAGKLGRFYLTTDAPNRFYFDDGSTWHEVGTNGGGGAAKAPNVGGDGAEGTSTRSARSDHVHPLPLATGTKPGALSAADKAKLDGATSEGVANALVKADASGRYRAVTPANIGDVTNKGYVDNGLGGKAPTNHQHNADDVNAGVLSPARLPTATQLLQGALSSADKKKLDDATANGVGGTIAMRTSGGAIGLGETVSSFHAARKDYVDTGLAGKANSTHTHTATQITDSAATGRDLLSAASTASARNTIGLPNVDNTADTAKPVSTAQQTALNGKSANGHKHVAADVTSGTFNPSRLPAATQSAQGAMSAADKTTLDEASVTNTPGRIAKFDYAGRLLTYTPFSPYHAASKEYVDGLVGGKANQSDINERFIFGSGSTSMKSPNGSATFSVNNSGSVQSPNIYTTATTGTWRTVTANSLGVLGYSTSARRYKTEEEPYMVGFDKLRAIEPKWFKYKTDVEEQGSEAAPWQVNFIADDLHDNGLTEYVSYDDDGQVETINESKMVSALWSLVRQLEERVAALEGTP